MKNINLALKLKLRKIKLDSSKIFVANLWKGKFRVSASYSQICVKLAVGEDKRELYLEDAVVVEFKHGEFHDLNQILYHAQKLNQEELFEFMTNEAIYMLGKEPVFEEKSYVGRIDSKFCKEVEPLSNYVKCNEKISLLELVKIQNKFASCKLERDVNKFMNSIDS